MSSTPPIPPRPSLKDIAAHAGVSVSLVSKVLNNRMGNTRVSSKLAGKIHKIAKEMGYRKNVSAQSLRTGRHNVLGVMLHRLGEAGSPLMENMVWGISETARSNQQKLMLSFFERDEEFLEMSDGAHSGQIDGLILGGLIHPDLLSRILDIQEKGVPIVTIFAQPIHSRLPNVSMEDSLITEIATRHLISKGCRSIGHILADDSRFEGYRRALREAGLPCDDSCLFKPEKNAYGVEAGEEAVRHWLKTDSLPEGIVAESDSQALMIINTLQAAQIDVPGQVKVTGVDNSAFCDMVRPTITSVSQENRIRGAKALQMLLNMIQGKEEQHIDLPPRLVIRGSTGG